MSDAVSRVNDSSSEGSLSHLSRGPRCCQRQYRLHGRGEEREVRRGEEEGGERERMEEKRSETRQVERICRVGKLYNCAPCTNAQYGILYGPWLGSDRDSTVLTSLVKKYTPTISHRFPHCMHCVLVTIGTQVERWTDTVKEGFEGKMERGNREKTGEEKRPGTE